MQSPDPIFILRGGSETPVNFVKFIRSTNTSYLWTASGDGKVVRWCLETMRPLTTISAHVDVNGGAFWLDGYASDLFTQGRDGVVKHFVVVHDSDEATLLKILNDEKDFGFCPCSFLQADEHLLAVPKGDGRVTLRTSNAVLAEFSPAAASLKLGMVMTLTIVADAESPKVASSKILAGYEDGSVILWSPDQLSPISRLRPFAAEPVMALDFDARLGLGFCGSVSDRFVAFSLEDELETKFEKTVENAGISAIKLRKSSGFAKLLAIGGWDAQVRLFTVKSLKQLGNLIAHKKTVRTIDFDEITGMMAVGSDDSYVSLWKLYCDKKSC